MSIQNFCPFFNWVVYLFIYFLLLSCMSCLYTLEIELLSVTLFATIFPHSIGCLFFLIVSFDVQKLISLIRSHWFIFVLFLLPWETDLRKHLYSWCLRMFCLCSLLVLWCLVLLLSLLSILSLFLCMVLRVCFCFIDLYAAVQFSQHHLMKRLSFPILYFCLLLCLPPFLFFFSF